GENRAAWARAAEIRVGKINLSPFFPSNIKTKRLGLQSIVEAIFTASRGLMGSFIGMEAVVI
ncbi:hypothetical protein, partial [Pseudomonas aeruginosa]